MTQAGRTGARTLVIARAEDAAVRREGVSEQVVPLAQLAATLAR